MVINHRIIWEGLEAAAWSLERIEAAANPPMAQTMRQPSKPIDIRTLR